MCDSAVDVVLTTARMTGLPKDMATRFLQVGLPMMAKRAGGIRVLLKTLYSRRMSIPPPGGERGAKQQIVDELETKASPMRESLFRDTARQAGPTLDVAKR